MSCRRLPQYHSDRGWILGVALAGMLALIRSALRGFTCVRCCSMPPASSPHALTGSCSCLWLTVASNRLCKGLAPSIDHSCSTYPIRLCRICLHNVCLLAPGKLPEFTDYLYVEGTRH